MVDMVRDPALLEWARGNQLTLRAYPVTKGSAATITLELELAHGATLTLDPGPRPLANVGVDLGVPETWATFDSPRTLALAGAIAADVYEPANERPRVDRLHSLVALPELSGVPAHRSEYTPPPLYDNVELRGIAIGHRTALAHCYALGRELDPTISSRVDIVVRLAPNAAPQVGVGGIDRAEVNTCLVDEVASWSFPSVKRVMTLRTDVNLTNYEVVTTSPKP